MLFADRSMIVGGDFGNYGGKDNMAVLTAKFAPVTVDLALSNGVSMRAAAIDSTDIVVDAIKNEKDKISFFSVRR